MKTVLLADDDENILEILQEILAADYRVVTAQNGREAWALFQKENFDLVVTDLVMPEMSGAELTNEIKALRQETPVLILSGGEARVVGQAKKTQADSYLKKPFDVGEVLAECHRLAKP